MNNFLKIQSQKNYYHIVFQMNNMIIHLIMIMIILISHELLKIIKKDKNFHTFIKSYTRELYDSLIICRDSNNINNLIQQKPTENQCIYDDIYTCGVL